MDPSPKKPTPRLWVALVAAFAVGAFADHVVNPAAPPPVQATGPEPSAALLASNATVTEPTGSYTAPAYGPPATYYTPPPVTYNSDRSSDADSDDSDTSGKHLSNDDHYTNVDGEDVHSPAFSTDGSVPDDATAQCTDGAYSFSRHHQGTCSGHGGVAEWLR